MAGINRKVKKAALTGGGTGGHIYPALALGECLRKNFDIEVFYIGNSSGMDRSIVEDAGLRFYGVQSGKFRRNLSLKNITDVFKIFYAFLSCRKILKKEKPDLLFSKGGFVSVPPAAAAASLKIPVWTHESDFSPGLATRLNSIFAEKIFVSYRETASFFKEKYRQKVIYSGNLVREAFRKTAAAPAPNANGEITFPSLGIATAMPVLLVLGGSQGAREVNGLVLECLDELTELFFVIHQTGTLDKESVFPQQKKNYLAITYIKEEMPAILASAALVLGRSGAGTVWEAATVGVPMVLVPLSGSGTRGDQVENAKFFQARGAALMLCKPSAAELMEAVRSLASDKEKLSSMAAASKGVGSQNAIEVICGGLGDRD